MAYRIHIRTKILFRKSNLLHTKTISMVVMPIQMMPIWMNMKEYRLSKVNVFRFHSGDQLTSKYFSRAQAVDDLNLSKNNLNLNQSMDVSGEAYLNGNVNLNASIKADSDIYIDGNVANCNNAVLYSEFGDIVIDTNNLNLTGLIYAPLGDVIITANNINLNNVVVIADTITLNANNVNANYNRSGADVIASGTETKASYITKFNSYMMDKEAETVLNMLSQYYTVTPIDAGDFSTISIAAPLAPGMIVNMDFEVAQYMLEGYGNLSIMKTDGVQQMSTIVLTPFDKDMPLISTDYMFMGESRISYIEFYGLGVDGAAGKTHACIRRAQTAAG